MNSTAQKAFYFISYIETGGYFGNNGLYIRRGIFSYKIIFFCTKILQKQKLLGETLHKNILLRWLFYIRQLFFIYVDNYHQR